MTYVYDANGNIVSKTPYTNVTSSDLSTATQGTAIVYGYGDGNWSDKLTSYDGQAISYDASGNPTSYRGETVTWNGRLMTSFTKDGRRYEYSYNSDGMRTVKRVYEGDELVYTYTYIWDGDVLLAGRMEVTDADEPITIRYLYDESGELYGMDYNGNGYFSFIKNLQGDIVSIVPLDSESNVEVNMEYDAWGKPIIKQASSAAEGFLIAVMMLVTNVGYRGYFYDFETGLYYLRSRYYDPEIGRFINADDTDYLGYDKSQLSINLFSYCKNNPTNYNDNSGNWGLKDHSAINNKLNISGKSFKEKLDYYDKMCDNKFASTSQISYPFHSRNETVLSKSVTKLFNFALYLKLRPRKKIFRYNEIFSSDGFSCYDKKNNYSTKTKAAINANNKILNVINGFTDILSTGADQATILLGFCLHMIQDFYAHQIRVRANSNDGIYKSNGYTGITSVDQALFKIYGSKFKRCSLEDNVNIFAWRYSYSIDTSKALINWFKSNKKLNKIELNKQPTIRYSYTLKIKAKKKVEVYLATYNQKLYLK